MLLNCIIFSIVLHMFPFTISKGHYPVHSDKYYLTHIFKNILPTFLSRYIILPLPIFAISLNNATCTKISLIGLSFIKPGPLERYPDKCTISLGNHCILLQKHTIFFATSTIGSYRSINILIILNLSIIYVLCVNVRECIYV